MREQIQDPIASHLSHPGSAHAREAACREGVAQLDPVLEVPARYHGDTVKTLFLVLLIAFSPLPAQRGILGEAKAE